MHFRSYYTTLHYIHYTTLQPSTIRGRDCDLRSLTLSGIASAGRSVLSLVKGDTPLISLNRKDRMDWTDWTGGGGHRLDFSRKAQAVI
jgi:hypothetical protein